MDTEAVTFKIESPPVGAIGISIKPVFQWTAVIGAEAYELFIALDAAMDNPVISRTGQQALTGNVWQCDVNLGYATTYYWRVRAINVSTSSAWSTMGIFTTEDAPLETPLPIPPPTMDLELPTIGSVAEITLPAQIEPTPVPSVNGIMMPDLSEIPGLPDWALYLIGGLLVTVILALMVILAIVIKIKRIT